ncbi:hypothetical protein [Natronocalculus amylovorans]|uniref:Uncharacterized protein n=1 Tax=Natronocalculus amylovorans TaxID=2917812 RepID=A0AAE3K9Q6_9EURY|nr:hypothetical protein [Natronocalculus amylovorans]MCL9818336.1 hypothetical protein [Natronocalculus amylovorans]
MNVNVDRFCSVFIAALVVAVMLSISVFASGIAIADETNNTTAIETEGAILTASHLSYIDEEVTRQQEDDRPLYIAADDQLRLVPQNFAMDNVERYGVETDAGTLTVNDDFGYFEFDGQGNTGTFEIWFEVDEEVEQGNETVTDRVRYEAIVRIDEATEYEHHPAGTLDQQREDAANWSAFVSNVERIAGSDADMDEQTDLAIALLEFRSNPLAALTGDFAGVIILLTMTPGGWFTLLLFAMIFAVSTYGMRKRLNLFESTSSERVQLDEQLSELELKNKKQALENMDWQDIPGMDDRTARAFRDSMGVNPLEGITRLLAVVRPNALVRDRLLAMSQSGYVALVERTDARTDGGSDSVGSIEAVELVHADRVLDTEKREVDDLEDPSEELIAALDWNDPELQSFDLPNASIDTSEMRTELSAVNFEDLMQEVQASRFDFEDEAVYGQYIAEFVKSVREHNFTDQHGRVDETRYVMNQFLHLSNVTDDIFEFPVLDFVGDAVERELIDHNPVEETERYVKDVEDGRYS